MEQTVRKGVILAAGKGTRFMPYTRAFPKEMLPIIDVPGLDYCVRELKQSNINEICVVISKDKEIIKKYFENDKITYVYQLEANGSASALLTAEEFIANEPVAVLNGDAITYSYQKPVIGQLVNAFEMYQQTVLGVQELQIAEISKYSSIRYFAREKNIFYVNEIIEKPSISVAPSNIAALGRYVISADFVKYLRMVPQALNGEYQLTDALNIQAKCENIIALLFDGIKYDIGDKVGYVKTIIDFALRDDRMSSEIASFIKSKYVGHS